MVQLASINILTHQANRIHNIGVNMQIQSTTQQVSANNTVAPSNTSQNVIQPRTDATSSNTIQNDTVKLSAQAIALSQTSSQVSSQTASQPSTQPVTQPTLPNDGEKVENYVHYKKAQTQYQFYSDLAGVATGSDNSMSASSAYIVKNNDDARAATVAAANMNNQQNMLDAYVETTKSINESV